MSTGAMENWSEGSGAETAAQPEGVDSRGTSRGTAEQTSMKGLATEYIASFRRGVRCRCGAATGNIGTIV